MLHSPIDIQADLAPHSPRNKSMIQKALRRVKPFPKKPWLLRLCNTNLLKTLREKEKLLVTSNFSFSHSVFYPFGGLSAIVIKFETLSVWKNLKCVVSERVNRKQYIKVCFIFQIYVLEFLTL